jgi:UDP-N-acetylglucosamine diphosphorylase/glucosamine-1-phosphate N-acetyltransferase
MNCILFDGERRVHFLPLTYTRPIAHLRIGMSTIREKWECLLGNTCTILTEDYLEDLFPMVEFEQNIFIEATYLPNQTIVNQIKSLSENEMLVCKNKVVAFFVSASQEEVDFESYTAISCKEEPIQLLGLHDLLQQQRLVLQTDFSSLTKERNSQLLSATNQVICPENIFMEEGAVVECCILNASEGPIYIGKNALVMEGSMIRGSFCMGKNAVVKMGSKIYGATSIGNNTVVGGELKNSLIMDNSNKGHEGYLGDSIVGEWCNLGANTTGSNIKNNYSEVKLWSYDSRSYKKSKLVKFGQVFGDYTRTAVNTKLNTGTIVGVGVNLFQTGFPNKFVPSFRWGDNEETRITDFIETAKNMRALKGFDFSLQEQAVLKTVFKLTQQHRDF